MKKAKESNTKVLSLFYFVKELRKVFLQEMVFFADYLTNSSDTEGFEIQIICIQSIFSVETVRRAHYMAVSKLRENLCCFAKI